MATLPIDTQNQDYISSLQKNDGSEKECAESTVGSSGFFKVVDHTIG